MCAHFLFRVEALLNMELIATGSLLYEFNPLFEQLLQGKQGYTNLENVWAKCPIHAHDTEQTPRVPVPISIDQDFQKGFPLVSARLPLFVHLL